MIAFVWPGSSVIHFAHHLPHGCIQLAGGPMRVVSAAVYKTSVSDGTFFDIPRMADALAAERYEDAATIRNEYAEALAEAIQAEADAFPGMVEA